ncbi:protein like [Capsicum annuum]
MQEDEKFTSVYVKRFWYENDSFVLDTQAKQVFYIDDPELVEDWLIMLKFQARHIYDIPEKENINSEVENDELPATNVELYQDTSFEKYEVEVDYNGEDSDQEDDTMVEYSSDHEENEDNNSATNNESDSTDHNADIDL